MKKKTSLFVSAVTLANSFAAMGAVISAQEVSLSDLSFSIGTDDGLKAPEEDGLKVKFTSGDDVREYDLIKNKIGTRCDAKGIRLEMDKVYEISVINSDKSKSKYDTDVKRVKAEEFFGSGILVNADKPSNDPDKYVYMVTLTEKTGGDDSGTVNPGGDTQDQTIDYLMFSMDKKPFMENGLKIRFKAESDIRDYDIMMSMASKVKLKVNQVYDISIIDSSLKETSYIPNIKKVKLKMSDGMPTLVNAEGDKVITEISLTKKSGGENPGGGGETPVETESKIKKLNVSLTKDGSPISNSTVRLSRYDAGIPNILYTKNTDREGKVSFNGFIANSRYEVRMANTKNKFDKDAIDFTTDKNGNIATVDGKKLTKEEYSKESFELKFKGYDKTSDELPKSTVTFKAVDSEGRPVAGVEFTANTITPKLASYKNSKSDEKGILTFELEGEPGEGRIYSVCVSKNGQFKWEFKPESIEIIVGEKGNVTYLDNVNHTFTVKRNDRRHLKEDLKNLVKKAKELSASNEYTETSRKELQKSIEFSEAELSKPETTPDYVNSCIRDLNESIKKLVKVDKKPGSSSTRGTSSNSSTKKDDSKKPQKEKFEGVSGEDRIQTAIALTKRKFKRADTVVIASGYNFADALSAASLTNVYKSPILLTKKTQISSEVLEEIKRLGAKEIIIIGGENSVASGIEGQISASKEFKNSGIKIRRIGGIDRYETSRMIAVEAISKGASKDLILAGGRNFADALSASGVSGKLKTPILLVKDADDKNVEFAKENAKKIDIIGGYNSLERAVEDKLGANTTRIAGKDRYETSRKIADMILDKNAPIYIASGANFPDALACGPAVIVDKGVLLLVRKNDNITELNKNKKPSEVIVVGGKQMVEGLTY